LAAAKNMEIHIGFHKNINNLVTRQVLRIEADIFDSYHLAVIENI